VGSVSHCIGAIMLLSLWSLVRRNGWRNDSDTVQLWANEQCPRFCSFTEIAEIDMWIGRTRCRRWYKFFEIGILFDQIVWPNIKHVNHFVVFIRWKPNTSFRSTCKLHRCIGACIELRYSNDAFAKPTKRFNRVHCLVHRSFRCWFVGVWYDFIHLLERFLILSGIPEGSTQVYQQLLKVASRSLKDVKTHNKKSTDLIAMIRDTKLSPGISTYNIFEWICLFTFLFIGDKGQKLRNLIHEQYMPAPALPHGYTQVLWLACATNECSVLKWVSSVFEPNTLGIITLAPFQEYCFVDIRSRFSPLHIACARGNYNAAKFLLDNGVDPSISGQRRATPIHIASQYGHVDIVRLLLDRNASVNAKTSTGVEVRLMLQSGVLIFTNACILSKANTLGQPSRPCGGC